MPRLHIQVKQLQTEREILIDGINDIRRYLMSDKFNVDTSVNKQDILNRFEDIQRDLNDSDNKYLMNNMSIKV